MWSLMVARFIRSVFEVSYSFRTPSSWPEATIEYFVAESGSTASKPPVTTSY